VNTILWAFKIFFVLITISIIAICGAAVLILVPGVILIYFSFKVGGFLGGCLLIAGLIVIGAAIIYLRYTYFPEIFDPK